MRSCRLTDPQRKSSGRNSGRLSSRLQFARSGAGWELPRACAAPVLARRLAAPRLHVRVDVRAWVVQAGAPQRRQVCVVWAARVAAMRPRAVSQQRKVSCGLTTPYQGILKHPTTTPEECGGLGLAARPVRVCWWPLPFPFPQGPVSLRAVRPRAGPSSSMPVPRSPLSRTHLARWVLVAWHP